MNTSKKILLGFLLLFSPKLLNAQTPPVLIISNDSVSIQLESVKIDVQIVGNYATTVTTLTFYNPLNRVLEGELNFPLAENQSVFRFAMDVNGRLREGVAVEKNLGREAFENVVRQTIDPGLLEKTVGNNYKARIYPIPAQGRKKVLIGYEEELVNTVTPLYHMLLDYGEVKDFHLSIEVINESSEPVIQLNDLTNFNFKKWRNSYIAEVNRKNFNATGSFSFELPKNLNEKVFRGSNDETDFFYIYINPDILNEPKKLPAKIGLYWDISESRNDRDQEKELDLLRNYLKHFDDLQITLITFSNEKVHEIEFRINNGESTEIIEYLETSVYDGGTNFNSVFRLNYDFDEILLFSDGISNLSEFKYESTSTPLYSISSSRIVDAPLLNFVSEKSGGNYINLLTTSIEDAETSLLNQNVQFLKAVFDQSKINSVFPNQPTTLVGNQYFSIAGKIQVGATQKITLHFGTSNNVTHTQTISIENNNKTKSIPRLWATKKVNALSHFKSSNKDEIIRLGKKYSLVTPFTSLIVLDRVEDYVWHEIIPPKELQKEYYKLLAEKKEIEPLSEKELISNALDEFQEKLDWWNNEVKDKNMDRSVNNTSTSNSGNNSGSQVNQRQNTVFDQDSTIGNSLYGSVTDADGETVPNALVKIEENGRQTRTDPYGNFRLENIPTGTYTATITFIGYSNFQTSINISDENGTALNPILEFDSVGLDEVVVSAFAMEVQRELTGSVSSVTESDLAVDPNYELKGSTHFEVVEWEPEASYLDSLKSKNPKDRYSYYLRIKKDYRDIPSFFLSVSNLLMDDNPKNGLRILSNIAEPELENHELLKILAHKYKQIGELETSIFLFKRILEIRGNEIQSKRDLALAYQENHEYQKALDLFSEIISTAQEDFDDRFPYIKTVILQEMNSLISLYGSELDLTNIPKRLIYSIPVDIRIVLDWNTLETDLDLWVTEPNGEKCFYGNPLTKLGGRFNSDFLSGYGPEEYILKTAVPGEYKIEVNYFDDRVQKISGPITLQVSIFTNYGNLNQKVKNYTVQLVDEKETIEIGKLIWEKS